MFTYPKIFIAVMFSGMFFSSSVLLLGQDQPTADDILKRYVEALGGKDNQKKVKSLVIEGEYESSGTEVKVHFKEGKLRIETTYEVEELVLSDEFGKEIRLNPFEGMDKSICIFDGEQACRKEPPFSLPLSKSGFEYELERYACHLAAQNLLDVEDVKMIGKVELGIDDVWCLEFPVDPKGWGIEDAEEDEITVRRYFDIESGLLISNEYRFKNYEAKTELTFEWKKSTDGHYYVANTVYKTTDADGVRNRVEFQVTELTLNPELDDKLFEIPK